MRIEKKNKYISLEEWKELILTSSNLKTMSEWMGSSNTNETYNEGVLYIGKIPYGRLILRNGILEIDISKSYLSLVQEPISQIAKKLDSEFYYSSNEIFDETKHLPTVRIKINREKTYYDQIEFPQTWMCIKAQFTDELLKLLSIERERICSINEISKYSGSVCLVRDFFGLTILMGQNLLNLFGSIDGSLQTYGEHLIKIFKLNSKKFGEIQVYTDDGCSGLKLVGKFEYGKVYLFEISYQDMKFTKGKRTKEIQNLSPSEISSLWSIMPSDLIFFKELETKMVEIYK
jgi:hypothetical protein